MLQKVSKAIGERPWIWLIVAQLWMIGIMVGFIVISVKYGDKDVPIPPQKIDY
jgi:hypothetical protein